MTRLLNSNLPLISVVIATHNSGRTIEKCLKTIKKQTYPNIEIVVVDSKNYDKNEQVKCQKIIKYYAKYFQDGPERSIQRNRGITEAKGEYILILDQDMYLSAKVIEECYKTLTEGKYVALTIPEKSIGSGFWTKCIALDRYITVYLEKGLNECARFFRKKNAVSIRCYDPNIVGVEDSDFHYRIAQLGQIGKIKSHILHDEGKTKFWDRVRKKYYYSIAFREYLKRRPAIATFQFFPIKAAYFKHWQLLAKHPLLTLGIVLLRSAEVAAGFIGLFLKR